MFDGSLCSLIIASSARDPKFECGWSSEPISPLYSTLIISN